MLSNSRYNRYIKDITNTTDPFVGADHKTEKHAAFSILETSEAIYCLLSFYLLCPMCVENRSDSFECSGPNVYDIVYSPQSKILNTWYKEVRFSGEKQQQQKNKQTNNKQTKKPPH